MRELETDSEVLEYAIDREVEARQFYLSLAKAVKREEAKLFLEALADEEVEHRQRLELELMKLGRVVKGKNGKDFSDSSNIIEFEDGIELEYLDVVAMSLEKEDAAYRTYVNLAGIIHDVESREMLLALAEEEVKHKIRWGAEYNRLTSNENKGDD